MRIKPFNHNGVWIVAYSIHFAEERGVSGERPPRQMPGLAWTGERWDCGTGRALKFESEDSAWNYIEDNRATLMASLAQCV